MIINHQHGYTCMYFYLCLNLALCLTICLSFSLSSSSFSFNFFTSSTFYFFKFLLPSFYFFLSSFCFHFSSNSLFSKSFKVVGVSLLVTQFLHKGRSCARILNFGEGWCPFDATLDLKKFLLWFGRGGLWHVYFPFRSKLCQYCHVG